MKNLRSRFERFCYRNRSKGIPNLMLCLTIGTAFVYLLSQFSQSSILYAWLYFDRNLILQGQVWRLITYPLTMYSSNILMMAMALLCYYSLGRAMENSWGTLRFNLFYLCGVLLMDVYCMIFDCRADVSYLNLSLFLSYATMYPDARFLLFFVIPIQARFLALFDLALTLIGLFGYPFGPDNLFPVIALGNYFLFFGKDVLNVIPPSWRVNFRRLFRKKNQAPRKSSGPKVIPFPNAGSYQATTATIKAPYTHRCTVCGRTDVSNPDLEFRYCSRCAGYHCYCQDHISNHNHITESSGDSL